MMLIHHPHKHKLREGEKFVERADGRAVWNLFLRAWLNLMICSLEPPYYCSLTHFHFLLREEVTQSGRRSGAQCESSPACRIIYLRSQVWNKI